MDDPVARHPKKQLEPFWTPEEHWKLERLAKKKTRAAEIAKMLGRSIAAVRREARQLGVLLYKRYASRTAIGNRRLIGVGRALSRHSSVFAADRIGHS